ncbi:TetR family transcriptional regulator [Rhizobium sp. CRIBSB]|nr:TetR family transcriptional regulator [Rhizobium sp. CRIBSB]
MAKDVKPSVFARKKPVQQRSLRMVETILEAAARILEKDGFEGLTTNAIAERAGISIGSLYEYFPNKEAILVAMARNMLTEDEVIMAKAIKSALASPGSDVVRSAVRALVGLYKDKQDVRRVIMNVHGTLGLAEEQILPVHAVAGLVEQLQGAIFGTPAAPADPVKIFVLVRAVLGVVRSAFNERSPLLTSDALEEELVMLIRLYASRFGTPD